MHRLLQHLLFVGILQCLCGQALAQCPAFDFTAGQTRVCQYRQVFFTAQGVPAGSSYTWIFQNDTVQGSSFQGYIFNGTGKFKVGLIITLPGNQVCQLMKTNYITVGAPPAGLTIQASKALLCDVSDSVTLTGSSTNIVKWDWSIGSNYYPNSTQNLTYHFAQPGYYSISLRAIDSNGCEVLKTIDSMVRVVKKPEFDFVTNTNQFCAPQNVTFTYKSDLNNSQTITGWSWNLPGAIPASSSAQNPTGILYSNSGKNDVGLAISTNSGCSYTKTKAAYISSGIKRNFGTTITSKYLCDRQNVNIKINTNNLDTSKLKWDLTGATISNKSTLDSQIINYRQAGKHPIKITYDDNACITTFTDTIEIAKLTPSITSDITCSCTLPATINYQASAPYTGPGTLNYLWTLYGTNGRTILQTGTNPTITQLYTMPGNYNSSLVVDDGKGCSKTVTKKPYAKFGNLAASVLAKPSVACKGQIITFSTDDKTICKTAISSYQWIFYDKDSITILGTSGLPQPQFSYPDTGSYNVKLIVTGTNCNDTVLVKKAVQVQPFDVALQASDSSVCIGGDLTFTPVNNNNLKPTFTLLIKNSLTQKNYYSKGIKTATNITFSTGGIYDVFLIVKMANACIDTIKKIQFLNVIDLTGKIVVTDSLGCLPFSTSASLSTPAGTVTNGFSYRWSSDPGKVVFNDSTATSPIININNGGCYPLNLKVTSAKGCEFNFSKANAVCAGVKVLFSSSGGSCVNVPVQLKNETSVYPQSYQWRSPSGGQFLPTDTAFEPQFIATAPGIYPVTLIAKNKYGCIDSVTINLVVQDFQADFTSPDTGGRCSPALITFEVQASYADSFFWDFDDGQTAVTTQPTTSHLFDLQHLSFYKDTFDITLVAKSKFGCLDTIIKNNYINVFGPYLSFQILNNKGCDPLAVSFKNNSQNLSSYVFDFGDGSPYLKDEIKPHNYTSKGTGWYSIYRATIVATDNKGCIRSFTHPDSIVVYSQPVAAFSTDSSTKCAPAAVQFTDRSTFTHNWFWDFDNDGTFDDFTQNPKPVLTEGIYSVSLKVTNNYGCQDSTTAAPFAVFSGPTAAFIFPRNYICFNEVAQFSGQPLSKYAIDKHHWDFGETSLAADTSNNQNPNYTYQNPGIFDVLYWVEDINGCRDSLLKSSAIEVADTVPQPFPGIENVTVTKDSVIEINWPISILKHFDRYNLWRNDGSGWAILSTIPNKSTNLYLDKNASIHAINQYQVQEVDSCANASVLKDSLPNVYLQTSNIEKNQISLTWNAFSGSVDAYKLYRTSGNRTDVIATLDKSTTSYFDKFLCDKTYCYYVEALHSGLVATSNRSCIPVNYQYQENPPVVKNVTVENNEHVRVSWQASMQPNIKQYLLERKENSSTFWNLYKTTRDTTLMDWNTGVNFNYYGYRVKTEDSCGNISEAGNTGNSILLKAFGQEDVVLLAWNNYENFRNGLNRYEIYRQEKTGGFSLIQSLPPGNNNYEDVTLNKACYLVKAVENFTGIESLSNIACAAIASRAWIPTAFSPNGDGVNDTLLPILVSIEDQPTASQPQDYHFCIYDRWGRKVFETTSPAEGWDGRFNGGLQPEGAYYYQLRATGADGRAWNLSGTVSLFY